MSEDSGKRSLRAFVDWVENGPDWDDEAGVHEGGAGGHGGENGVHGGENGVHGAADPVYASGQAVNGLSAGGLRNLRRNMPCVYSAVSTGLWRRSSVWRAWQCFS